MEVLRRLYRVIFFAIRGFLAISIICVVAIQLSFVQEFLLNTFALPSDSKIKIERVAGFFPFDFLIQKVSLNKNNTPLFWAEKVKVSWSIADFLIRKKIHVSTISVENLTVYETESEKKDVDLPIEVIPIFQNLQLDNFDIRKLVYVSLKGGAYTYLLHINSDLISQGVSFLGCLKSEETQEEVAKLSVKHIPTDQKGTSFHLSLSEKDGGLLSYLMYGEKRPIHIHGSGVGELSNFSGEFQFISNLDTIKLAAKTFVWEGKDIVAKIEADWLQGKRKISLISRVNFDDSLQNIFLEEARLNLQDRTITLKGHITRENALLKTTDLITELASGELEIKGLSSLFFNLDALTLSGETTGRISVGNSQTKFDCPYNLDLKNQIYNLNLEAFLLIPLENKEDFDLKSNVTFSKDGEGQPWNMKSAFEGQWGKVDLKGVLGSNPTLKGVADIYQDSYDIFSANEEGGWACHVKNKNNLNDYGIEKFIVRSKTKGVGEIHVGGDFNVYGNKLEFDSDVIYDENKKNINFKKIRAFFRETFLEANGLYNLAKQSGNIFWHFYSFNISDLTRNGQSTGAVDIVGAVDIQDNIPKFSFSGDANKLFYNKAWCRNIKFKGEYVAAGKHPTFFEMLISDGGYRNNSVESCKMELKGDENELLVSGSLLGATKRPIKSSFEGSIKDFQTLKLKDLRVSFGADELKLVDPVHYTFEDVSSLTPINLKINKGSIKTRGKIHSDKSDFSINFHKVSGPILSSILGEVVEIPGVLSGSVKIMGAACDPLIALSLMLDVDEEKVLQMDGNYKGKIFNLESKMNLHGLNLYSKSRVPVLFSCVPFSFAVTDTDPINISLKGSGNIGAIHKIFALNFDRLGGDVWADLSVKGSISDPVLSGVLRLKDGFYRRSNIGLHLGDITFGQGKSGRISNGKLTVAPITITDGKGGSGVLYGDLKLAKNLVPWIDFTLKPNNVRIVNIPKSFSGGLTANVFGEFNAKGLVNALKVTGKGEINPFEQFVGEVETKKIYRVNVVHVNLNETPHGRLKKQPSLPQKEESTELDLHLDLSKNFLVYGQGLQAQWKGSLDIKGKTPNLVYKGDFKLKKGTLSVMDRKFDVKKGSIYFEGDLSPQIYIEAEHQMKEMKAIFVLKGDTEDLQLEILSDKSLTQSEILERLFFDRNGNSAQAVQALNFLTRRLQNQFESVKFGFYQAENPINHTKEDVISISKDLGDYFYAKGEMGLERNPKAAVGVNIKKNIKIEGSVTTNKKVGVGAEWKWRY